MSQIILLILAVYAVMVGYHNHAKYLFSQLGKDLPKFMPWIIAIVLLGILAVNKDTEKLGKPILGLIVLGIVVKDWSTIQSTSKKFYSEITS
jgi:hypothetical protein